jgi:predicted dehydrogenase
MLDMGPYYLTALVNLIAPIRRVTGSTRVTFAERTITSQPKNGAIIHVEVPTHVAGVVDFANGAVGTIIMTFDVWAANLPRIEIYGSEGSLSVPDPNTFGGEVRLRPAGEKEWRDVPLTHSDRVGRGIGVADMAYALTCGRPHRASGALAYHVLDAMEAFEDSSRDGRHIELTSGADPVTGESVRPAALPVGLTAGTLDK